MQPLSYLAMIYKRLFTLLFAALLACFSAKAHSRTEIGYSFHEEDQKTYLEVHLTSLTLFDLVYDLRPELKSQVSLNLGDYTADYESYFNEKIDLELNHKEQTLKYVDANLIIHDATIKFLIEGFDDPINSYKVAIGGFDFYQNPSFTVMFKTTTVKENCFLSKGQNICSKSGDSTADQSERYEAYWIAAILPFMLIIGLAFRGRLFGLAV